MININRLIITKALTLVSFVSLVTLFVLYRAGKFEKKTTIQTSPNGGAVNSNKTDTVPPKSKDSSALMLMPSSKSIILSDRRLKFSDSLKKKNKKDSLSRDKQIMFSSSKSGRIINQADIKLITDSLKADSVKEPGKKKQ